MSMSMNAADYGNDSNIEMQWAMSTFKHAEVYFKLICSVPDTTQLKLNPLDDLIYQHFRKEFPDMKIDVIDENEMKSKEGKEKWRTFCEMYDGHVEDFNMGTLLRIDASDDYTETNSTIAPRIQFLAIEIARNKESFNAGLADKFKNKKPEAENS